MAVPQGRAIAGTACPTEDVKLEHEDWCAARMGRDHQIGDMGCAAVPGCLLSTKHKECKPGNLLCLLLHLSLGRLCVESPLTGLLPLCAYKGGVDGCRLFCSHLPLLGFSLFSLLPKPSGLGLWECLQYRESLTLSTSCFCSTRLAGALALKESIFLSDCHRWSCILAIIIQLATQTQITCTWILVCLYFLAYPAVKCLFCDRQSQLLK